MALLLTFNPITANFDLVQDLSEYAKLDGSNQPFTGDVSVPNLFVGNTEYGKLSRTDTLNTLILSNRVNVIGAKYKALDLEASKYITMLAPTTGDYTISTLVYFKSTSSGGAIFSQAPAGNPLYNSPCFLLQWNGSSIRTYAAGSYGSNFWTPTLGVWYNLVITYTGTTARVYVDGALLTSRTLNSRHNYTYLNSGYNAYSKRYRD